MYSLNLKSTLLFLLCLSFTPLFAQPKFVKGYLVLNNGDTLKGYLQEQVNYALVKTIRYKNEIESTQDSTLSVSDIVGLTISETDEIYFNHIVDVDKKQIELSRLENNMRKDIKIEKVLLKVLVRGKVDLYQYIDENSKLHFFYREGTIVTEFGIIKFIAKNGQFAEIPEYKQQLQKLFSDCPALNKRIFWYSESSFVRSFIDYNNCSQSLIYAQNKKKKNPKASITLHAGISLNDLSYNGADELNTAGNFASQQSYSSPLNPILGISTDLMSKGKFNTVTLYLDASWQYVGKYKGSNNVTDTFTDRKDYSIDFSYINSNIGMKYFFNKNSKISPFLKFGVGLRFLLSQNSTMVKTSFNASQELEPLVILSSTGFGVSTSIGCILSKHFQIELCYHITKLKNIDAVFKAERRYELITHSPSLVIGYRILK